MGARDSAQSPDRARWTAGAVLGALAAGGISLAVGAETGSAWRELGLAVLSGAIVGGALVLVEGLLASAADRKARREQLLFQLSSTTDLNGIDLAGVDLNGLYLPGRALVAARLSNASIEGSKLFFADLRHADLSGARLSGADLSGATLAFARLTGARLQRGELNDADLSNADLSGADLSHAVLFNVRLVNTCFAGSNLSGARFESCLLEGADFRGASRESSAFIGNSYDESTRWGANAPHPPTKVEQPAISEMDLSSYLAWRAQEGRPAGA